MYLYSTIVNIAADFIHYDVSRENELLLFKPKLPLPDHINAPIFWVGKQGNSWQVFNVHDEVIVRQVVDSIGLNNIE